MNIHDQLRQCAEASHPYVQNGKIAVDKPEGNAERDTTFTDCKHGYSNMVCRYRYESG